MYITVLLPPAGKRQRQALMAANACSATSGRLFITDHKPLAYAFSQKRDKCSPRQFNHLDFISQFTADIRHISGQDNVVADALSRAEAVCASISPEALAK